MNQHQYGKKYQQISSEDYSDLFRLVREVVWEYTRKTRPGILLGLAEMGFDRGNFIGGLHFTGTNEIYLNRSALRVMKEESSPELTKAYIFLLLTHEYLHSVGVHSEGKTRELTAALLVTLFGEQHPSSIMAQRGLNYYFPYTFNFRRYRPSREEIGTVDYVKINHPDSELTYL